MISTPFWPGRRGGTAASRDSAKTARPLAGIGCNTMLRHPDVALILKTDLDSYEEDSSPPRFSLVAITTIIFFVDRGRLGHRSTSR